MDERTPPVTLHGNEVDWRPVSPRLRIVRWTTLGIVTGIPAIVAIVLSLWVSPWWWIGVGVLAMVTLGSGWLIARMVSAISWVELPEEIVIRKGRLFRSLSSIPYGRLQYIDTQSGPLMRRHGLASLELHTASPGTSGNLPGLHVAEAEALRERLAARSESQRAGL